MLLHLLSSKHLCRDSFDVPMAIKNSKKRTGNEEDNEYVDNFPPNVGCTQVPMNYCKKKVASDTDIMLFQCAKLAHEKGRNPQKMKTQLLEPWPKIYINNLFILLQVYSSDDKPSNL